MKHILMLLILTSSYAKAQNLTQEEQRALLKDVRDLKAKVQKLESGNAQKGLKTVDFKGSTTENTNPHPSAPTSPSLTPEQTKVLMETLQKAKLHQAEQEKALKELENEE